MLRLLFVFLTLSLTTTLARAEIALGQPLPPLAIEDRGEVVLQEDEIEYVPWALPGGLGRPHIIQYMAGTMKARDQTRPFTDSVDANIPDGTIHFTTVINLDQAVWGSTGFVVGKIKSNKKKHPQSTFVLDEEGVGQETWALAPKDAAVVILDPGGTVLFFKEGAMSEQEINQTIDLIRQHIAQ